MYHVFLYEKSRKRNAQERKIEFYALSDQKTMRKRSFSGHLVNNVFKSDIDGILIILTMLLHNRMHIPEYGITIT